MSGGSSAATTLTERREGSRLATLTNVASSPPNGTGGETATQPREAIRATVTEAHATGDQSFLDLHAPDGHPRRLRLEEITSIARERRPLALLHEAPSRGQDLPALERGMLRSAAWVAERIEGLDRPEARPIYGISTGFGALSGQETFRSRYHARVLQRNLLVSHAAGTGAPLEEEVVRAAATIRVRQLVGGQSGIRIGVVNRLIGLLNAGLYPLVPELGSLGASGDLAPMAHLALVLSQPPVPDAGDQALPVDPYDPPVLVPLDEDAAAALAPGEVEHSIDHLGRRHLWERRPASKAMAPLGGTILLEAKEALALTNGATFSAALATLALMDARRLLDHGVLALAMSLEAARGFRDAFLPGIHQARGLAGQARVARRVLALTRGSTLLDPASREQDPHRVPPQDPYSLRCAPQVLGAAADAMRFVGATLEAEVNAAVDNPLIFPELPRRDKAVSGGNFHGAPIGYGADLLKIVLTDMAAQSERRCFKLTDLHFRDERHAPLSLPMFLIHTGEQRAGLNSGLMIPQYTAASLVSACKVLAHPDSVDSISSSAGQEDHVSMSMNAARHLRRIVAHAEAVIAIELLTAAQALHLREGQGQPGEGIGAALAALREVVSPLHFDRAQHPDIQTVIGLMRAGALTRAADAAVGPA